MGSFLQDHLGHIIIFATVALILLAIIGLASGKGNDLLAALANILGVS